MLTKLNDTISFRLLPLLSALFIAVGMPLLHSAFHSHSENHHIISEHCDGNISVFADEARIRKQIKSAVTDTGNTPEGQMSEGIENLFAMLKATGNIGGYTELMEGYKEGNLKYVDLKHV